jgi:phosphatidylserine decarboxylase
MVQIAGLLARRIISYVKEGDDLDKGERVGLICFGSRVDLYFPEQCQVQVGIGQKVKAGSSVLGRWL